MTSEVSRYYICQNTSFIMKHPRDSSDSLKNDRKGVNTSYTYQESYIKNFGLEIKKKSQNKIIHVPTSVQNRIENRLHLNMGLELQNPNP